MEKVKLSNFIKQIRGVSYKPEDIRNESDKNAIPILRANNITVDGHIDLNDIVYVDSKKVQNEQLLRSGDIFICASSGSKNLVGKAVYIPTDMPYAFGAFCKVVRPISENLDKHYLAQFFQSPSYRKKISDLAQGANINNIKNEHIDELDIAIYSLEEQKAIAEKLDKVSGLIEKRKTQLEKLDLLIKSRFIEMFGDPIKNSNDRSTTEFINVVKMQRGFDLPVQDRVQNGKIPVFGSNGVLDRHNVAKVFGGGVITGRSGTIGRVYYTEGDYWPLNTSLFSVDTHGNNIIYLAHLLQLFDLSRFTEGTGVPTLNRNKFHNQQIIDVPLDEQEDFATFVEQVDKSKFEIQKSLEKLEILKKSLMQQYFG